MHPSVKTFLCKTHEVQVLNSFCAYLANLYKIRLKTELIFLFVLFQVTTSLMTEEIQLLAIAGSQGKLTGFIRVNI